MICVNKQACAALVASNDDDQNDDRRSHTALNNFGLDGGLGVGVIRTVSVECAFQ